MRKKAQQAANILHVEPVDYLRTKSLIAQEEGNRGEFIYGFSIFFNLYIASRLDVTEQNQLNNQEDQ